jgi:hypothetical protein
MSHSRWLSVFTLLMSCVALTLRAQPASRPAPAPAPAAPAPAEHSLDAVRTWYVQLADRDPEVRERARINLMGIKRRDLPALEKVVAENRPVQASQAAVLYDIVTHVYMAGEPYPVSETMGGFLGLRNMGDWDSPPGVMITTRIPGFPAYRLLREGDVVVGIEEAPDAPITGTNEFVTVLRQMPAGSVVTLRVLRGGNAQKVAIRLDPRPAVANGLGDGMNLLESTRQAKADEYWARAFATLVGDQSVSAAHP